MSVITEIYNNNNCNPVLVEFQNGKFNPGEEHNLKSGLYKTKSNKVVVGIESQKIAYTGIVSDTKLYNDYIVIHNKRTKKCRLVPVDFATLQPQLKKKRDLLDVTSSALDTSISDLNKQFGSKKTIRITEQHERLKMNIDSVKEDLEKTVADIEVDFSNQNKEDDDGVYRPKINRGASVKEDVYNFEDILPSKILDSMDAEVDHVMKNLESIEDLKFRPFVAYCLQKLRELKISDEKRKDKIKILTYIHYLLHFFSIPIKNLPKKISICENNKDINFHILDNFSSVSMQKRHRSLSMKTKAVCYALVLTLFAMDYEVNIEELSKDIKMGIKKIQEIGRVLALSQGKDKNYLTLKLPLPAVVQMSAKRKRK
ncbi:unnamed protein product [Brassicogethes aeneus]|uniref:DNA-directed RNA polymerase I subunit RPA49 n=1 Tax=Brassicogethes aeneus TaxID=1431903 RepID=A0A9P0AXK6_BRAAE|nr:unnamed protein product [Brassicogethes aeneus]